jgi:PHP domain
VSICYRLRAWHNRGYICGCLVAGSDYLCRATILTAEVISVFCLSFVSFELLILTEFCSHAVDTLEEVIEEAIRQNFDTFGLTEHMPRDTLNDLYPEEVSSTSAGSLFAYKRNI